MLIAFLFRSNDASAEEPTPPNGSRTVSPSLVSARIRKLGTKVYVPTGKEKVSKIPEDWLKYESSK